MPAAVKKSTIIFVEAMKRALGLNLDITKPESTMPMAEKPKATVPVAMVAMEAD